MHGWIIICYWSSKLYRIFCLRLFFCHMLLLYLHSSIYSIIHTNLLYFGYYLLDNFFICESPLPSYLNHIISYILVYQYIIQQIETAWTLLSEAQKIVEILKCSISSTAYMEQRIMADTTIYMYRHNVIYASQMHNED